MRLTTIILITALLQVQANSFAQKVTIRERNIKLTDVFNRIRTQTGYDFLFTASALEHAGRVTINVKNQELEEVLNQLFTGLPLDYKIANKSVIVSPAEKSFFRRILDNIQAINVKGTILDESGKTLVGATVTVKGSGLFSTTDHNGNFSLSNVPEKSILVISYVGFKTLEINASGDLSAVVMQQGDNNLQEVIVNKGYYSTSQKLNTGSTVQISASQLETQPLTNPIQALQGLVPGMYIKQTSGVAGSASTVLIRGRNSINSGLIPLYIIDGTPFSGVPVDQQVGSGATIFSGQPNGSTDPLSNINPNDIESITVLKDADATAIYGSRGANGVVLVTTKRAGKGKPKLEFGYTGGRLTVVNQRGLLSSADYLSLRRNAFANDVRTPTAANAPDLALWDQNANTNYQDLLIGNTAIQHDFNSSLSMGTTQSSLLLGGNYHQESSVLYGAHSYKKGGVNIRATHNSADNRLKLDLGTNISTSSNRMAGSDFASDAITIPANYPLYDASGKLYWVTNFYNPVATSNQETINKSSNILINGNLSYQLLPSLSFKANAGYNIITQNLIAKGPASTQNPLFSTPVSSGIYTSTEVKTFIAEPQLVYGHKLWKGQLNANLGGSWQQSDNRQPYFISANTFASESLLGSFTNAANFSIVRSVNSQYRYISAFALLNYNLMDKYVINAVFRRDGSSRFGPNRKYGNFGSVGAAWILSEEKFIKDLNVFSFAKLRSSYGITGNDQFENYSYMDTYTSTTSSYGGNPGFYPTRIANPDFSWETNKKFEVAAELGFLEDRIHLTTAYYRNRSGNMVVRTAPLPGQTGFNTYITNLDALVQNSGLEFDLHTVPVKTKNLTWDLSFNISTAKNKLLSLPADLFSLYGNTYSVGNSLNSYIVYHHTGFTDGVAQFQDRNGDGSITSGLTNDSYVAGSRDPKFFGGISSGLSYKQFRLDFLINFVKQKGLEQTAFPGLLGSQLDNLLSSPFKASTLTSSASYVSYTRYVGSDGVITDASFMRLRNLSLSYAFPEKWKNAVKAQRAQLFLRGENLFTLTKYKGLDPETQGAVLPPLKVLTAGIQCSF